MGLLVVYICIDILLCYENDSHLHSFGSTDYQSIVSDYVVWFDLSAC